MLSSVFRPYKEWKAKEVHTNRWVQMRFANLLVKLHVPDWIAGRGGDFSLNIPDKIGIVTRGCNLTYLSRPHSLMWAGVHCDAMLKHATPSY